MLRMILCVDKNNGIAQDGIIPWKNKLELKHFKSITKDTILVMGHNTFKTINHPLANRKNIVLSKNKKLKISGVKVINNYQTILKIAKEKDVSIIGGKQIYELFNDYCDEIIITKLNNSFNCNFEYYPNLKFFVLKKTKKYDDFSIYYYSSIAKKILNGKTVRNNILKKLIHKKDEFISKFNVIPKLAIIQIGNDYSSNIYIKNKIKLVEEIKVDVEYIKLNEEVDEENVLNIIDKLNNDENINGILIQLPLPNHICQSKIAKAISPIKDVDCFHPYNLGLLFRGDVLTNLPCTPAGIMEIFKNYKIKLERQNVTIIGRSNIVTKPLSLILLKQNATITMCHSFTKNIQQKMKSADIIISAAGKPNLIKYNSIKKDSIIIDVSINRQDNKIVGDVEWSDKLLNKVKYITPVPGGVGLVTIVMLLNNLLLLTEQQIKNRLFGSK